MTPYPANSPLKRGGRPPSFRRQATLAAAWVMEGGPTGLNWEVEVGST